MVTATGAEELRELVGRHLGHSGWTVITQEQVTRFADLTGDAQWIHVDPQRAADSAFGGTIAHGHLILSLAPMMLADIWEVRGFSLSVNYGCDRVRFLGPVRVGSSLRAGATLESLESVRGGVEMKLKVVFEGRERRVPVCVARLVVRNYV
ncbi:MaoC family dehydratase [Streptomyces europaeiscabiei]|uniref:MaoC family dehydratase n=1 Tax=Streptomyces europaeiscabiei TaxID=146819 RepID=UPI0029B5DAB5|nr:MaoC family dehydratase [Streptomyces europaeiscabiei]MDX2525305.1 MaoC family dehydratase [Streptomyces europaeiscabiei]